MEIEINGSLRSTFSTFHVSDWLNEKEHAVNLNTCSWRVQEKAGFMKSRWLFFTTDQWIRNGRTSKSQRICRGNLMFHLNALCAVYLNWKFPFIRSGDWNWGMIRLSGMTRRDTKTMNLEEASSCHCHRKRRVRRSGLENWFNCLWCKSSYRRRKNWRESSIRRTKKHRLT